MLLAEIDYVQLLGILASFALSTVGYLLATHGRLTRVETDCVHLKGRDADHAAAIQRLDGRLQTLEVDVCSRMERLETKIEYLTDRVGDLVDQLDGTRSDA